MYMTRLSSLTNKFFTAILIMTLMVVALPATPAFAASITVNTTVDENANNASCSLREAIIAANNNATYNGCTYTGSDPDDVITLTSGLTYTLSIVGNGATEGDLDVGNPLGTSGNLTIQASGSTNAIIDANDINRVIELDSPTPISLTLNHITITNGNSPDGGGIYAMGNHTLNLMDSTVSSNVATGADNCGAGIYDVDDGHINIVNSTIADNTCTGTGSDGGGIFKGGGGSLIVSNSTFYNNSVTDNGGGVRVVMTSGTATITNSTFVNNVAGSKGGGLQVNNGSVTVEFSTFSGNAANTVNPSAGGAIQADGGSVSVLRSILANSTAGKDCDQLSPGTVTITNSLVEDNSDCTGSITSSADPGLGALSDNGGPTQTMAIAPSSPAFDAALTCASNTTDQRGVSRPQSSHCDIGAYERAATFVDVPFDYWSWSYIEGLSNAGVTAGCGSGNYCPTTTVTRDQMAVFLLKAKHGSSYTPPAPSGVFGDVPTNHWAAAWIERLAAEGITAGCGSGNYCPGTPVTRDQMAVFLLKAKHGSSYSPPTASGVFEDVPTDHWAAAWIERLAAEGITAGCSTSPLLYCPATPVTRDQMAVFLVRTFNLPTP
jgi:CSLREA domain-containing protein